MRIRFESISASGLAIATLGNVVFAQGVIPLPPAAAAAPQAAIYDPQQFPAIRGQLDRLTLTARGDIDGLILTDGTEVKIAPGLSTQIAFAIKRGDRVTVHGLKAAALPLVSAVSITDEATHRTVTDSGISGATPMNPPPLPGRPARGGPTQPPGATGETSGRVRMALHGPQGEVNGVLLDSGTILRFPPDQSSQLTAYVQPHQAVVAEGSAITNTLGTVVDVRQIGPSHDRLVAVGPPSRPMEDRGPAGPRRRPPPPAEGAPETPTLPPAGAAPGPGNALPPAPSAS